MSSREVRRSRRRRKRRIAAPPPGSPVPAENETGASEVGGATSAALVAFVLCLWGQSLLLFDWARRTLFDPDGSEYLILVAPLFGGAVLAALAAAVFRSQGRAPVGGPLMHGLGLASGLLGLTALFLVLWLGPRLELGGRLSRHDRSLAQLESIAAALEDHRQHHGTYPIGVGAETLAAALAPEFLAESFAMRDPWGHEIRYLSLGGGAGYLLVSLGPDGVQDLTDDEYLSDSTARPPTNDVALLSGRLVAAGPSATSGSR